jgi:uncharacterized protein YxjI
METSPAGWHPDPHQRHELRYWDGSAWTQHVSDGGRTGVDAPNPTPTHQMPVTSSSTAEKIRQQVTGTGARGAGIDPHATPSGGGTIFTEPVLVVNQKAKLIEINNQYAVFDRNGTQLGFVTQVGQSTAKKILRVVSSLDQFLTHTLQVCDMAGNVLVQLTRPAKVFKSTVVVTDANGAELGRIVQQNVIGKIHFGLESGGHSYGSIHAENWRAWNFSVQNHEGREVARVTKTFEGVAKTLFTTADNYVVQIHEPLQEPLRTLVVASALSIDTALKQDSRGLG